MEDVKVRLAGSMERFEREAENQRRRIAAESEQRERDRERDARAVIDSFVVERELSRLKSPEPSAFRSTNEETLKGSRAKVTESRSIRVFLSSTFRDMMPEREFLVKQTFPNLKSDCSERNVCFTEIDLRWGITAEGSAGGTVIETCLNEIDNCRPYFICILGERYGWAQDAAKSDALLARTFQQASGAHPWVLNYQDRSVTELEILYGALFFPMLSHRRCFFYFRDPAVLDRVPASERPFYEADSRLSADRLASLKERIYMSGLPVRRFDTPEELGMLVARDLTSAIDRDFPIDDTPRDLVQQMRATHETFAFARTRVYVPREALYMALDSHVTSTLNHRPLVVLGESGMGKSALLANWRSRAARIAADAGGMVITHFIGCANDGNTRGDIMRRLMMEFKALRPQLFENEEIPQTAEGVEEVFVVWLHTLSSSGEMVILIIDALDQVFTRKAGDMDISWLPKLFPPSMRVIVSCVDSENALAALDAHGWLEDGRPDLDAASQPVNVRLEALGEPDRRHMLELLLKQYSKTLSATQMTKIVRDGLGLPLFIKALVEELRVFGKFEQLDSYIASLLATRSVAGLYERIFQRWETDYGTTTVCNLLGIIWAARDGVTEAEALEILGVTNRDSWSPFFRTVQEGILVCRQGLHTFFHGHVTLAVVRRYLGSPDQQNRVRGMVADYFKNKPLSPRMLHEYPWLLDQLGRPMISFLSDVQVFLSLYNDVDKLDLFRYWRHAVGAKSGDTADAEYTRTVQAYEMGDKHPTKAHMAVLCQKLGTFHHETGFYNCAKPWLQRSLKLHEELYGRSDNRTADAAHALAALLEQAGEFEPALAQAQEALWVRQRVAPQSLGAAETICLQGLLSKKLGRYPEAEERYKVGLLMFETAVGSRHPRYAVHLQALGDVYRKMGAWDRAHDLYTRVLELNRRNFGEEHPAVAEGLDALGLVAKKLAQYEEAELLHSQAVEIMSSTLGETHPKAVLFTTHLGDIYRKKGEWLKAKDVYERALLLNRHHLGEAHPETAECWNSLGLVAKAQARYDDAVTLYTKATSTMRAALGNNHPKVAVYMSNLADVFRKQEKWSDARSMYTLVLQHMKANLGPEHVDVAETMHSLGLVEKKEGHYDQAQELFVQALRIVTKSFGDRHPKVAMYNFSLAEVYRKKGLNAEARDTYTKALELQREQLGEMHPEVGETLNALGMVAKKMGRYQEAAAFYQQALLITTMSFGAEHPKCALILQNQGDNERKQNRLDSALSFYQQALAINERARIGGEKAENVLSMCRVWVEQGNIPRAERTLADTKQTIIATFGERHPKFGQVLLIEGDVNRLSGRYDEALNAYAMAMVITEAALGSEHADLADMYYGQARVYAALGNMDDARTNQQRALVIVDKALGKIHPKYLQYARPLDR